MTNEELQALRGRVEALLAEPHDPCEGDCWYACPKSGMCCDGRADPTQCSCGKDARDVVLRDVVTALTEMRGALTS